MRRKKKNELPPLFYCDNCGAEVSQSEPSCPSCGRKFASIRCPACGFSGEEKLFDDGCPECGYQVLPGKGGHKNRLAASGRDSKKAAYDSTVEGALPAWAYFLTFAFFVFALSFLLFYMSR
jgi:DNA-directed RNA polymerase subunit RPC12/RpoP